MFTDDFTDREYVVMRKHFNKERLTLSEHRILKNADKRAMRGFLTDLCLLMAVLTPAYWLIVSRI